jgi:hypothetical protein
MTMQEYQLAGIEKSDGRVYSFLIQPDGGLSDRQTVISGLPVGSLYHGINAVEAGPDGRLYVSIGGVDEDVAVAPRLLEDLERDPENLALLGTIVSVRPDGSDMEVFARGLRNIYDLEFDRDGNLIVVDNDGVTVRGQRNDEIIVVQEGDDYGYPFAGSFDPYPDRVGGPIWHADQILGAAGIEWAENVGLDPGLVIGSYGGLDFLAFNEDEEGYYVAGQGNFSELLEPQGYLTALEAMEGDRLVAAVYGSFFSLEDVLMIIQVDPSRFVSVQ